MNPPFNSKSKVLALCMLLGVVLSGWLLFSIEKERRDSVPTQDDWAKFGEHVAPLLEDGDVIRTVGAEPRHAVVRREALAVPRHDDYMLFVLTMLFLRL